MAFGLLLLGWISAAFAGSAPDADEFVNSLGMHFRKVGGTAVRFSIWETRVRDWRAYSEEQGVARLWGRPPPFTQTEDDPAVNISLGEAQAFCEWLTRKERASGLLRSVQQYRLPTDAEWDAAIGLGAGRDLEERAEASAPGRFPWGDAWPPPAAAGNFNRAFLPGCEPDRFEFTAPVGSFAPSKDGLFDLAGNVWEWTTGAPGTDPPGGEGVLRGGSWMYWRKECLDARSHLRVKEDLHASSVGFRCVLVDERIREQKREQEMADRDSRRRQLIDRPKVTAEEVEALRSAMSAKREFAGGGNRSEEGGDRLPRPEKEHVNSLQMELCPLPEGGVLLARRGILAQEFEIFLLENGRRRRSSPGRAIGMDQRMTGVTWEEAVSFCLWLTQRERVRDQLPEGAHYRLPRATELNQFGDADGMEWCQDVNPARPGERAIWHRDSGASSSVAGAVSWASASSDDPDAGFRVLLDFAPREAKPLSRASGRVVR